MLVPRTLPTAAADSPRVDELVAMLRREAAQAEADPFDDAMLGAVVGLAEVMKAQAAELGALRRRMARMARRSAS